MKSLLSYKQENNSKYKNILHNSVIVFVHTFIFGPIIMYLGEDETYGCFLNGGTPKTPQKDHFSWNTHGCWVPPF